MNQEDARSSAARPEIERRWLGRVPYGEALEAQRARREALMAGQASEALWALEHDPVITTGRRAAAGLPDEVWRTTHGVALYETERGGLATWHGPGQLVVYAILDAGGRGHGPRSLVAALEDGLIAWLAGQGAAATRRAGYPGVWVPSSTSPAGLDKIAAVGLHFRRGFTLHGLALNLCPDLRGFDAIVPCGISDASVTSLERVLGRAPGPEEAAAAVLDAVLARILRRDLDAPTRAKY